MLRLLRLLRGYLWGVFQLSTTLTLEPSTPQHPAEHMMEAGFNLSWLTDRMYTIRPVG